MLGVDTLSEGQATREDVAVTELTVVLGRRGRARRAVDGLDLNLGPGVHGLLGPNGAGKTTLIRVLATVIPPTSGSVRLLGSDIRNHAQLRSIRQQIGYLPQSFGFYPRFTVTEFVTYFAWLKEHRSASIDDDVATSIARVGLTDKADAQMRTLSGGMVRRAGLAQALVNSPRVLLLDEPTAGLDPEQRLDFRTLLRELASNTTVLVSTHLVEDVASACSQVTLMDTGSVVWSGTPTELENYGRSSTSGLDSSLPNETQVAGGREIMSAMEAGYTRILRAHRSIGTPSQEGR